MNCKEAQSAIANFEETPPEVQISLMQHIGDCKACEKAFAEKSNEILGKLGLKMDEGGRILDL